MKKVGYFAGICSMLFACTYAGATPLDMAQVERQVMAQTQKQYSHGDEKGADALLWRPPYDVCHLYAGRFDLLGVFLDGRCDDVGTDAR